MTDVVRRWTAIIAAAGLSVLGSLHGAGSGSRPNGAPVVDHLTPMSVCPVAEAGGGFSSRLGASDTQGGRISVIGGGTRAGRDPGG